MIDEKLICELFESDPNIVLVAAYGSYSRGEEAYVVNNEGVNQLYNDFDVVVVVNDLSLFSNTVEFYKKSICHIIGGADVDILVFDGPITNRLKSTVWYRDFMYAPKIFLGGKRDLEFYFGKSKSQKISVFDVFSLFATRSWAAGCLNSKVKGNQFTRMFKSYQAAKLVIATVDLNLLTHSKYTTSLRDKLHTLELINDDFSRSLIPRLKLAIQVKLSPSKVCFFDGDNTDEKIEHLLSDYNDAFSGYLASKLFASDLLLKFYMIARYLKTLVLIRDRKVAKSLCIRHKIANLVRAHKRKNKIPNYNDKMVANYSKSND